MADQRRDVEQRPSPEALLEAARREGSGLGKLKIFVGAAPGVGKTYAMLEAARAKLKDGVDVVAAVVETHGRKETQALLDGLLADIKTFTGEATQNDDLTLVMVRFDGVVPTLS